MLEDAALLRRYAEEKSETAFAELVARHFDLVYSAALRQVGGDAHRARDVSQEVFSLLARKAPALTAHPVLAGWLYTATRHAAARIIRTEARRTAREQEAHLMQNLLSSDEGSPATDWPRVRAVLDAAMADLSERDRQAVLLRFFAHRPFAEIGLALEISEDGARMRVERALDKLHGLLARRGITSTGAALSVLLTSEATAAAPAGFAASVATSAFASAVPLGPLAAAIHFMNTSKIAATTAVLMLSATVAATAYELQAEKADTANLANLRSEVMALAVSAEITQQQLRQVMAAASSTAPAPRPPSPRPPTEVATSSTPEEKEDNGPFGPNQPGARARGRALMAAYPELHRLVTLSARARVGARYRPLYKELGLTTAQIEAVELVKAAGVGSSIERPGLGDVTLEAAPAMPAEEKESRLKEILGADGYARMQEFERTPQDYRVPRLASQLYFTDTPLTSAQAAQFQSLLSELNRSIGPERPADYWTEARKRAAVFLSPQQLAELRGLQANDEYSLARIENQKLPRVPTTAATK